MNTGYKQESSRRWQSGWKLSTLTLLLAFSSSTMAAIPFELDGNVGVDTAGNLDWTNLGSPIGSTGVITDNPEISPRGTFTGGGSKDEQDIPNWRWTLGSTPDKDDITHAYAAAYNDGGDLVVVFGADRFGNSGSAQFGFWFLQDGTFQPNTSNNQFTGHHQAGDKLILVEFTKGGTQPNFGIYEWQANGTMKKIVETDIAECTGGTLGSKNYCGISNKSSTPSNPGGLGWTYTPKSGTANNFPIGTFFEGAINVTKTFGNTICITDFLAETRSSHQISATLKDFSSHDFNTCGGIEVTKACTGGTLNNQGDTDSANDTITYTVGGTVTKSGLGGAYNVALTDNPDFLDGDFTWDDCHGNALNDTNGVLDQLGSASTACYHNSITVPVKDADGNSMNGTSDTMSVAAGNAPGGTTGLSATSLQATCPTIPVDPTLAITKECTTEIAVGDSNIYALVKATGQVCNTGTTALYDVQLSEKPDEANATTVDVFANPVDLSAAGTAGACATYNIEYVPTEAEDISGTPTSNPHLVSFKDTVSFKSATNALGGVVSSEASVSATCPLCLDEEQ